MSEYIPEKINRCEMTNGRKNYVTGNIILEVEIELDTSNIPMEISNKICDLVETAPELLEVAEYSLEIVKTLDCHCDSYNGFTCKKHEWKRKLESIIKKAKGELNANNN